MIYRFLNFRSCGVLIWPFSTIGGCLCLVFVFMVYYSIYLLITVCFTYHSFIFLGTIWYVGDFFACSILLSLFTYGLLERVIHTGLSLYISFSLFWGNYIFVWCVGVCLRFPLFIRCTRFLLQFIFCLNEWMMMINISDFSSRLTLFLFFFFCTYCWLGTNIWTSLTRRSVSIIQYLAFVCLQVYGILSLSLPFLSLLSCLSCLIFLLLLRSAEYDYLCMWDIWYLYNWNFIGI